MKDELASCSDEKSKENRRSQIQCWNLPDGKSVFMSDEQTGDIISLTLNPFDPEIACVDRSGWIHIFDGTNGSRKRSLQIETVCAEWSPDGTKIACSNPCPKEDDQPIFIVNSTDGTLINPLASRGVVAVSLKWNSTGDKLASCSGGVLYIWDAKTGYLIDGHTANVYQENFVWDYQENFAWDPTGDRVAYTTKTNIVCIYDLSTRITTALDPCGISADAVAWSHDGLFIAASCLAPISASCLAPNAAIRIWKIGITDRFVKTLNPPDPKNRIMFLAWSPVDYKIAAIQTLNRLLIWGINR